MQQYRIIEVDNPRRTKQFLELPYTIYKDDSEWVCPLLNDIESVFDPVKNNFFSFGKCKRWILEDENQTIVGRIAAFINFKKAHKEEVPTGGCGFFECINSQVAADSLFNQAKIWLSSEGMLAMNGPINFGETDTWWGLLIDGFKGPYYGMNYNPPYYKTLFERFGFTVRFEQISNHVDVKKGMPEKVVKIAQWAAQRKGFQFRHLELKDIPSYARDFKEIYNDAWKHFDNFTPVTDETIVETIRKIKPIMDPKLIWFAYSSSGEPISFIMILPDTNELIKDLHGKLGSWGKVKFLWKKFTYRHKRMRCVIMGTKEKFRNQGLESCLFMKLQEYVLPHTAYSDLELSWVGDFNEKMLSLQESIGATYAKKHVTYYYRFS